LWSSKLSFGLKLLQTLGIQEVINIPVIHCPQSYGLILTIQTNDENNAVAKPFKFVYSGDTRPCDLLIEYGQEANVLIHEATFEDNKVIEAIQKKHSTISEAQQVAQAMHAEYLILTHFSQRYHGIPMQFHPTANNGNESNNPRSNETEPRDDEIVKQSSSSLPSPIIAFDFMTIKCEDLPWLEHTTSILAEIFPAETIEDAEEIS